MMPRAAIRVLLVVAGLGAWFTTQALIGARSFTPGTIGDGVLQATAPVNEYLHAHPFAAKMLLISSSAVIDLLGVFLLGSAICGPTIRPLLGLLLLFALRQLCQALCALPPPNGMIWEYPGFPSLLVTYGVSNDLFFSGHTAIAVFGATELARLNFRNARLLGAAIALFEASTVLVLRAHYTMDVFTGAITALLIAGIGERLAPVIDRRLDAMWDRPATETDEHPR
jgi:hypothetical protein